ncbi:ABC transporter substrate-binding protein [Anabaena sp. FACHB-709]|uniref:Ferrichrome ABC transporter, ferrichrome-binding protein n=2 Tax=Nostocaceae TaxID=1162 RepID=A0A1Z4KIQ9_ANAVA|nr:MULTISPECIES: helical backbone metal receptor [Nostocaceae]BAY68871.1 ferrichrome ABC transporter, ferrichrome-binding protein [Trichormus variabilis NIES-23]HBW31557.1 ABC transporter substrate-binding protein [Nostoc sp. UBA8866]MBD2170448.1 ABC transporter substrate-binding protein [Anabaena cylindrica FACHB-318]MBD2262076.1 ABC transporter substrate-binding protein [Anabaena sp. FACHB-709]MBD2271780.1 ABC transporter substrate-binding protein [Nostoc sp. PCC 7120 = FACHB-418]
MNKHLILWAMSFLVTVNLWGCANNPNNSTATDTKQAASQPIKLATRVVALTPLGADLIYNLDKSKLLAVPAGRYTDVVAKAKFAQLPRIGGRGNINLEKIVALKPDLVIGSETFQGQILNKLKELGINTVSHETRSWQDLKTLTEDLAGRIGADPKPILDKYQSFIAQIPENGKSVLVLVSTQPTLSPNRNSWSGDLLEKFQYKNVTGDLQANTRFQGYLTLSQEQILATNPEKIFIMESDNVNPDDFKKLPFWNQLKATQNNQVYIFHHDGLISPTSVNTVEEVTNKLRQTALN